MEAGGDEQCWIGFVTLEDTLDCRPGCPACRVQDVEPPVEDGDGSDTHDGFGRWIARFQTMVRVAEKLLELLARDWAWIDRFAGRA